MTENEQYLDVERVSVGDWIKVRIGGNGSLSGGYLYGTIVKIYPEIPQIKLDSGWCCHPTDIVIEHKPQKDPRP